MCTGGEIVSALGISKAAKEGRRALEDANIIHGRPDIAKMQAQAQAERAAAEQGAADMLGMRRRAYRTAARANSLLTGAGTGGRSTLGV
jgi:hypothetical protein